MRVLLCSGADRGGFALYTERLAERLRDEGLDAPVSAPSPFADGAPPLPRIRWGDEVEGWSRARVRAARMAEVPRRARALLRAIAHTQPDVVHVQTTIARHLDPLLFRLIRRDRRLVVTVHNPVPHEESLREARVEHRRWKQADALIVHGTEAVAPVRAGAPGVPVSVIPVDLLVRTSTTKGRITREEARRRLGLHQGPLAGMLGLVRPYKGLDLLCEAWPAVHAARPDARLAVVGSAPERFPALDTLSQLPGVDRRDEWLSDEEFDVWAAAVDVGVLPYRHGTHSGVLHRHVAQGTPVLASPVLAEEVEHLSAGRAVPLDPSSWSTALADALGDRPLPPPAPSTTGQGRKHRELYESLVAAPGLEPTPAGSPRAAS